MNLWNYIGFGCLIVVGLIAVAAILMALHARAARIEAEEQQDGYLNRIAELKDENADLREQVERANARVQAAELSVLDFLPVNRHTRQYVEQEKSRMFLRSIDRATKISAEREQEAA